MLNSTWFLILASTFVLSSAQKTNHVPKDKPIPGNYTGQWRPQVHFSPPSKFMNDPNGMFLDAKGTYHLYYQYNPTDVVAGDQHWGHATSKDLYHWINQPIALYPLNGSSYIFSGSAVIDKNNTSGFFPGQDNGVVAIFTIATYEPITLQTQGIAYSYDDGYTFDMYKGNPVLDVGSANFRDPKVFWYNDHWVMAVAYSDEFVIGFYTSHNLKEWHHASNLSHVGLLGQAYECPNLVEVPVEGSNEKMWLLQISINPGSPQGGSISQYFPGHFDGYKFTPADSATRFTDWGKDNYAGQFFYGLPESSDAISLGWSSNWQYAQVVPTGEVEGWRSSMSVPRRQTIRRVNNVDYVLTSQPYDLSPVLGKKLMSKSMSSGTAALDFGSIPSNALYFEANVTHPISGWMNFTFTSPVSGEYLQGGVALGTQQPIWLNRGGLRGFDNPFFTDKLSNVVSNPNGITKISGVIDRSLIELFANEGEIAATTSFFPVQPLTLMTFGVSELTPSKASASVAVWELKSAWKRYENAHGVVVGNVTKMDE